MEQKGMSVEAQVQIILVFTKSTKKIKNKKTV